MDSLGKLEGVQVIERLRAWEYRSSYEAGLHYYQAHSMVAYLVDRYRMPKIKHILAALKDGKTCADAFREILHLTFTQFEDRWRESL